MSRNLILIITAIILLMSSAAFAGSDFACPTEAGKPTKVFSQADMDASGKYNMSRDTVWHLYGRVHVKDGYTLYVQSGTIIKGDQAGGDLSPTEPSALIIDQGGYAKMIGDSCCPIIMTYLYDDVDDPNDMPTGQAGRGLWGGLILLGYANIGDCGTHSAEKVRHIEGIPTDAWDYDLVQYGCDGANCNDNDNSGIYRYISIRHGGTEIGEGNEINGMTFGAVGAGTKVDHIEVYENLDDGYEWFGGCVSPHHLVSAFNGDDCFDYDQGFRGYGQFWFAIEDDDADNAGEHDGNEDPEEACPFARPDIANVTYMGPGKNAAGAANVQTLLMRDNAGGHYNNSIFVDFPNIGLNLEDTDPPAEACGVTDGAGGTEERTAAGDLTFSSMFFWDYFGLTTGSCANVPADRAIIALGWESQYVFDNCNGLNPNNCIADPQLISYPPTKGAGPACRTLGSYSLNPRPALTSPVLESNGAVLDPLTRPPDGQAYPGEGPTDLPAPSWYHKVPYAGAFDPTVNGLWTDCWTAIDFLGYTGTPSTESGETIINQAYIMANGPVINLPGNSTYLLEGRVHIVDGYELYVGAGAIFKGIQANPDTLSATEPSALIIDRGGYAEMIGTEDNPIIMTYLYDDVDDPRDMPTGQAGRGLWGGLIVLGHANIGICDAVPGEGERHIEGIPTDAWDYDNVTYGCSGPDCDDNDNSGIFEYISIRHGGTEIGEGNEINGMTFGAVGAGTTVDHIEVYENLDDGYEWFGGCVCPRYLVSAFNGDDAFDYDQGFRGYGQYWFVIQDDDADNGGEHDGNEDPEEACPFARPDITNVTYIGPGQDAAGSANVQTLLVRDNAGAHYSNSIFLDYHNIGLNLEDTDPPAEPCGVTDGAGGTEERMAAGDLTFTSMFFWNYNGMTGTDGCANVAGDRSIITPEAWASSYVFDNCNGLNGHNCITDPKLCSYPPTKGSGNPCRQLGSGTLNPRPLYNSPVLASNGAVLDPLTRPPDGPAYPGDNSDLPKPAWFQNPGYAGAFSPTAPLWTNKWTFLHFGGYTCDYVGTDVPGDVDGSGNIDIDDIVYLIAYIFSGGPAPLPVSVGDADCVGGIDIDDVIYLIAYAFTGGPAPRLCDVCPGVEGK